MRKFVNNVELENVRIIFRNFAGKKTKYNREGERNFTVVIDDPQLVEQMREDGWNVRTIPPREEGQEEQYRLQVAVSYRVRPPKIVLVTKRARQELTEDTVESLDYADIKNVDLIISPYHWTVDNDSGIKAYVRTMYVTIEEDRFAEKYADYPQEDLL